MQKSSQKLGIWWDTDRGVWSSNTPGAVEEPMATVDLGELRSEIEEWLGSPIEKDRDAMNEWQRFIDDVNDSQGEKTMKHETLKRIAESYIKRERDCGHTDARILRVHNKSIRVHAGNRDDQYPCGYNETLTPAVITQQLDAQCGVLYDAAKLAGVID